MPLPTLICIAFATGLAAALAASIELRVTPRPPLLTRGFAAYAIFLSLVLVPVGAYFYLFHGDWFLLYAGDSQQIPSALALVGFVGVGGVGAIGFAVGASMVRGQREALGGVLIALSILAAVGVVLVAKERLSMVGSIGQFEGGFGLTPFSQSSLAQGALVMSSLLFVGTAFTVYRLYSSGRRS